MNARRKLHLKWDKQLKQWWIDMGYPQYCEICGGTFGIAFAHSKKRRFIDTETLYRECALLCQPCHRALDEGVSHEHMENTIKSIIEQRGIR